jgi:drug/metabolite transporter (DMT)-like permease
MTGILALTLCILTTCILFIVLRATARYDIDRWQVTGINYAVAALVGLVMSPQAIPHVLADATALGLAVAIGTLFVFIFYVMTALTQQVGLSYMTIVSKMSLAIPVVFSWWYYKDSLSVWQGAGVVLALMAIVLINVRTGEADAGAKKTNPWITYSMAAILFLGCGIGDSLFKVFHQEASMRVAASDFTIAVFAVGALGAMVMNGILLGSGRTKWRSASLWAGLAIGIPNYFSIFFLATALQFFPGTVFYPIFNTAMLVLMALVGVLAFKEKLNVWNMIGLATTLGAVALLV